MQENNKKEAPLSRKEIMQFVHFQHYILPREEKDPIRKARIEKHKSDAAPVIKDLKELGFTIYDSMSDIFRYKFNHKIYKRAIPVLIKWLSKIENLEVKDEIISCLRDKNGRDPAIVPILIKEFYLADELAAKNQYCHDYKANLGDAIGNSMNDDYFDQIISIVQNKKHGDARIMLVLGLAKLKNPKVVDILIDLLKDEDVQGHAVTVLRKLKAKKAAPYVEPLLNHPITWIRNEAKKYFLIIGNSGDTYKE